MLALDAALAELNQRLRLGGHRCRVERRNASLYLRATLPARDDPGARRQQRIAAGLPAAFAALPQVEQEAVRLGQQLRDGSFDWAAWDRSFARETLTVEQFRAAGRALFDSKPRSPRAWSCTWGLALRRLPERGSLSVGDLVRVVRALPEGSATRKVTGSVYASILDSIEIDGKPVRKAASGYSTKNVKRRDVPTDDEIENLIDRLSKPNWHWTIGMIATYGLRPHEVLDCILHADLTCEVSDGTKTGSRIAWPCHSHWVERFNLTDERRPHQDKYQLFKSCGRYLKYQKTSIRLYDLRHAYAIRLLLKGVPPEIGARIMGHSLLIHTQIYQRWVRAQSLSALRSRYDL